MTNIRPSVARNFAAVRRLAYLASWILATGFWSDGGAWRDGLAWID